MRDAYNRRVCSSHAGIESQPVNVGCCCLHRPVAQERHILYYKLVLHSLRELQTRRAWIKTAKKQRRFSTNKSLYLRND